MGITSFKILYQKGTSHRNLSIVLDNLHRARRTLLEPPPYLPRDLEVALQLLASTDALVYPQGELKIVDKPSASSPQCTLYP
jgi:hypothetical protein